MRLEIRRLSGAPSINEKGRLPKTSHDRHFRWRVCFTPGNKNISCSGESLPSDHFLLGSVSRRLELRRTIAQRLGSLRYRLWNSTQAGNDFVWSPDHSHVRQGPPGQNRTREESVLFQAADRAPTSKRAGTLVKPLTLGLWAIARPSSSISYRGMSFRSSSNTTRVSIRANAAPRQEWSPKPNAMWSRDPRVMRS